MAPPIRDKQSLPESAKSTAEQIEKLGFKWEFDWEYPVPDPDKTQRVQIRNVAHLAPQSEVNKYKAAMKRGDKFPPGVVTRDGMFVDFNTRAKAAHALGWPTFPVFVINVHYGNAPERDRERVRLLGAAFNTKGPKPLARDEIADIVRSVAPNPDYTAERVAALLGVTTGTVNSVFAQFKAETRAEKLGVKFNGSVNATNRAMLGQKGEKLTDKPFREIARLAQDCALTGPELRDLCKQVQEVTGSDDEKVAIVEAARAEREPQIAHFKATGKSIPPPSVELRKRLSFILSFKDAETDLVDYNPNTSAMHLQALGDSIEILQVVFSVQREVPVQETVV